MLVLGLVFIIYLYLTCGHRGLFISFSPQRSSFERKACHSKNDSTSFHCGILIFRNVKIFYNRFLCHRVSGVSFKMERASSESSLEK